MTGKAAVAVISKLPHRGRTKTRLAATLGQDAALALHRAFLRDELEQLSAPTRWRLYLIHDAPTDEADQAELAALCTPGVGSLVPGQPSLARELLAAFESLLATHKRAVIVSGDVPQLSATLVADALGALDHADLVLGPNPDGGYYLVGMRAVHDVFTRVPMSTPAVEAATRALARERGLTVATLPTLTDMDQAQDLLALESVPADVAVRTRREVAGLERCEVSATLPTELQVEVSSRCNLRCGVCLRTHHRLGPDRDLSAADFAHIIEGLPRLERVAFQLNGEPLMCRELPEMIAMARAVGAETVVNTNGVLLTRRRRRELLDSGIDAIRISLHGASAKTHDARVGVPVFERVITQVAALAKERGHATAPWLSAWMVATREAIAELPDLVDLAAELGLDGAYLQRLVVTEHGGAVSEASLHGRVDARVEGIIAAAEERANRAGIALRASGRVPPAVSLSPPQDDGSNPWLACWRPWRSAVVTAAMEVLPCCISSFRAPYADQRLGNRSEASWEAIWNDEPYRRLRRGLLSQNPAAWCQGCTQQWSL